MPIYALKQFDYDFFDDVLISNDEVISEEAFRILVKDVMRDVVERILSSECDAADYWNIMNHNESAAPEDMRPVWGELIEPIVEVLCRDHGFEMIETTSFGRGQDESWTDIVDDPEGLLER